MLKLVFETNVGHEVALYKLLQLNTEVQEEHLTIRLSAFSSIYIVDEFVFVLLVL